LVDLVEGGSGEKEEEFSRGGMGALVSAWDRGRQLINSMCVIDIIEIPFYFIILVDQNIWIIHIYNSQNNMPKT